jgi:hypothetical protein
MGGGASYEALEGWLRNHEQRIDHATRLEILEWVPVLLREAAQLSRAKAEAEVERKRASTRSAPSSRRPQSRSRE